MQQNSIIKITFEDLAVIKVGNNTRLPLTELDASSHIHGALLINIGNRFVPYMGYWGANDVCFSQWIEELERIRHEFKGSAQARYCFDEGEQGQPAFLFEREGETMYLSIIDSAISDGEGNDEWQKVRFSYREFISEYEAFYKRFCAELQRLAPTAAREWVSKNLRRAG
ncbi:MAG: hypothetical protein RMY28_034690 [Nostoc sp. ChiSLP01]|nr:hypothetical protein [Nostoc sp. CmiSLP01]MDZ8287506.1 hypothetical protein [Nostoc sp. ChiSLP01]